MGFDLARALRSLDPQGKTKPLRRRGDNSLPWVEDQPLAGTQILLDTTVYIDVLRGVTSVALDNLISNRICNHSAVCLSELTHGFGRLDPSHPQTSAALSTIEGAILDMPPYRLSSPDSAVWGNAGILAGLLFRLGAYPSGAERKCLNDALLFLQARKFGIPVVTRNIRDFDYLNQLVPDGKILLYRI